MGPLVASPSAKLAVLDCFSCVGNHHLGFSRVGCFETRKFVEILPWRQRVLASEYPGIPIHDDICTLQEPGGAYSVVFGGPPCQETSRAAAIHGHRTGTSLAGELLRVGFDVGADWICLEQPPGAKEWKAAVAGRLSRHGYHSALINFGAHNCGAPYIRRRDYILASPSLSRLEVAGKFLPQAIEGVARSADARGTWDPVSLRPVRVDAWREEDPGLRRLRIEAFGDSNPPEMAEVIGRCIEAAL